MKYLKVTAFLLLIGTCLSNPTKKDDASTPKTNSATLNSDATTSQSISTTVATKHKLEANQSKAENTTDPNDAENEVQDEGWEFENTTYVDTRRILYSKTVSSGKRPYMVYLSLTKESAKAHKYRGWLCGGVILDPHYVLTSAACVEDADRFYIVSGTTKFVDSFDYKKDDCVCKNRRKVVWKCIPKNYKFDFQDSIKWSSNDIAIVKVEKPFKIGVLEKGCQFATQCVQYNNISRELEKAGTKGYIAGWGSGSNFREGVYRRQSDVSEHRPENAKCLQEAKVCIMDNEACSKKWAQRFRSIITQYMICTKDVMKRLSEICDKKYANCTDVLTRRQDSETTDAKTTIFNVDLGRHLRYPDDYTARRSSLQGGFCENDHGGPLLVKYQGKERVIGVISACKIDPKTHNCHGPFLYTSIFKNRQFISCAIHKDVEGTCRRVFRSGITHEEYTVDWKDYVEDEDRADDKEKSSESSEESGEAKQALRKNVSMKEKTETATKKIEADSSSSAESTENKKEDQNKDTKAEKAKTDTAEKKGKSKKDKKSKSDKKTKHEDTDDDVRTPIKTGSKDIVYESSKDENVNEPEE